MAATLGMPPFKPERRNQSGNHNYLQTNTWDDNKNWIFY